MKWLLDRIELRIDPKRGIQYPCGSMFWFRAEALEPLLALDLQPSRFTRPGDADRDHGLAHGIERTFLYFSVKAGKRWAFLPEQRRAELPREEEAVRLIEASGLFDPLYYRARYPDAVTDGLSPLDHYVRYGSAEGRNPSSEFDVHYYDSVALRVSRYEGNPLVHYLLEGRARGLRTYPAATSTAAF